MSEFDKIIGYEKEKEELKQICDILVRPQEYAKFNIHAPRGVLLEGVPGVGKTMMAWALIKESKIKCFLCKKDKPNGEFVKKITKAFEDAKNNAPAIVFLDDLDKFAEKKSRDATNEEEFVAVQAGMELVRDSEVFVIATVNDKYLLPQSLKRSGRFDKTIEVDVPTLEDAEKIIEYYLKDKNVEGNISPKSIAKMINGYSCADLENILNEAGVYAIYNGFNTIQKDHIVKSIARSISNIDLYDFPKTTEKLKRVAYHEAGHSVMAYLCKTIKPAIVTVCKGNSKLGFCQYYLTNADSSQLTEIEERIKCGLAGKVSEEIFYNDKAVGVGSDHSKVYESVRALISKEAIYGYNYISFDDNFDSKPSQKKLDDIATKISYKINDYYTETRETLLKHKNLIQKVANMLVEKKILSVIDFEELEKTFVE